MPCRGRGETVKQCMYVDLCVRETERETQQRGKWEREYVWLTWYAGSGGRSLVRPLRIPHLEITYAMQTAPAIFSCLFQ